MQSDWAQCPYGNGFLIPKENAINPCFFELLILLNSGVLFLFGSYQLFNLIRAEKFTKIKVHKLSKATIFRLFSTFVQSVILFKPSLIFFVVNSFALLFIALPLTFLSPFVSPVSNGTTLFYFLFSTIIFGFSIVQSLLTDYEVANNDIILYLGLVNGFQIFISATTFYKPVHEVTKYYSEEGTVQANILSQMTFTWMNPLIEKGYRNHKIVDSDIPTPPTVLDTRKGFDKLNDIWERQTNKSLFYALIKVFGWTVLNAVFYQLLDDILAFVQPQLLRLLIKFFNEDEPIIVGFLLAFGLFLVSIISTALYNKYFLTVYEAGLGTKASLMTMVYHKALKLSPEAKKERSSGDIINIMSVDVNRIQDLTNQFQMMVSAPVKLVLCLISLYSLLGNATLAGIVAMAIMIPINSFLSRRLKALHKAQMKFKDQRTSATSELLSNIKSIKLYAIEESILKRIDYIRNVLELGNLKKIGIFSAVMNFSWYCVPFFVSCSSFAVFAIFLNRPLTPEIVFPALALFDILSEPIYAIPAIVTAMIETSVSFERITKFLLSEEIDKDLIQYLEKTEASGLPAVEVSNAKFLWESIKEKKGKDYDEEDAISTPVVALTIDEFTAKKGELTCIVGRVGSGKSTFLQAILGYLPTVSIEGRTPRVKLHGSVAYCAQVPWIMNASVKENVMFGHRLDEDFYQKTIEACQLVPDLEVLPDGDATQVGEKGISLSGGQKARLSLARAVYARADIYLLDDVLSAVDAHVGKKIINEVLVGLLATKTIVLATNSISVLSYASQLVLLEGGKIVETGSLADVSKEDSKLAALIKEFGNSSNSDKISEDTDLIADPELSARRDSIKTIRRASVATFKKVSPIDRSARTAQTEEKSAIGKVDLKVYKEYAKACGYSGVISVLLLLMLTTIFSISANYWLKNWSEDNAKNGYNKDVYKYIAIYAFFGVGSGFFTLIRTVVMWVFCAIKGSTIIHNNLVRSVTRSPMSFFETTPLGRIINRFTGDINKVDEQIPRVFSFFFSSIIKTIFTLGFIGYTLPSFLVVVATLSVLYIYYQRFYIGTSRDLKRIVNVSRSPIYSHLQETLVGCDTVRAYNQEERFHFLHLMNLDFNLKSLYIFRSINRWLSVRLQFIGSIIIFSAASLAIVNKLSPGLAGLVISYALSVTSSLSFIVRMTVEVETNVVSIERVLEYCDLKPEAAETTDVIPPSNWPARGSVKFDHYSTKYRETLDLVLNDITLEIKPQEKIGIVGRTGAGKSTLSLAIFRMIEPVSGRILIDDVDINQLGLFDLRSNLAIIPQDSQAFEGTVRQNLDPLDVHTDGELWRALELSHLKAYIESLTNEEDGTSGLGAKLSEGGFNLSVGQRQLLCLARALLNPSKVLILDEATASVDVETDKIVQETIREAFADRTILTIAHRIDTVLDSDRIVVLERGQVKEFDTPQNLLKDKDSLFHHLCSQGGYISNQ